MEPIALPKSCFGRGERVLDRSYECANLVVHAVLTNAPVVVPFSEVKSHHGIVVQWTSTRDPIFDVFRPYHLGGILQKRFRGRPPEDEKRAVGLLCSAGAELLVAASYGASIDVVRDFLLEELRRSPASSILNREVVATNDKMSLAAFVCSVRWRVFSALWSNVQDPLPGDLLAAMDLCLGSSRDRKIDVCVRRSVDLSQADRAPRTPNWRKKLEIALAALDDHQLNYMAALHDDSYWFLSGDEPT